jgi:hypothetical protein
VRSLQDGNDTEVKFGEYKFYTSSEASNESLVDIHNWHDVLKKETSEKRDLWIIPTVPDFTITKDTNDGVVDIQGATNSPEIRISESDIPPARPEVSMSDSSPTVQRAVQPETCSPSTSAGTIGATIPEKAVERANTSYILSDAAVQPFFEWPFFDDEGKLDKRSPEVKVRLWLNRIHGALQTKYGSMIEEGHARDGEPAPVVPSEDIVNERQRKIRPRTYGEVYARLEQPEMKESQHITEMKSLCFKSEKLFELFVPFKSQIISSQASGSHASVSQPNTENAETTRATVTEPEAIRLYWGAVDALVFVNLTLSTVGHQVLA